MKILAIDTATEMCGAAITDNEVLIAEHRLNRKNMHNETLVTTIDGLLTLAGQQLDDIDAIAISAGPGSFTGLRIGYSVAKGLAFSHGIKIIPVNTLDVIASNVAFWQGDVVVAIKARSTECYIAKYQIAARPKRLTDYMLINLAELQTILSEGTLFIMNPHGFIAQISGCRVADVELAVSRPANIARLAMTREPVAPELLEPGYLSEFQPKRKKSIMAD